MLHPRSEDRNETGEPSLRKKENRKRKSATKYPLNWMQPLREGRKEKEMVRETERPASSVVAEQQTSSRPRVQRWKRLTRWHGVTRILWLCRTRPGHVVTQLFAVLVTAN